MSPPDHLAYEPSLTGHGNRLAAAWHGGPEGTAIWLRFTDFSGTPAGSPVPLTDGKRDAYEPDLQSFDGDLLLAWYEKTSQEASLQALVARFDERGGVKWQRALSGPGTNGRNTVARIIGNEVAVAWIETPAEAGPAIWTARLDAAGQFIEAPARRAQASRDTWNLNAASDDAGTFYVVYDASLGTRAKELRLLSVRDRAATEVALSVDDGYDSTYPDLALSGERAALTWFDARDGTTQVYLFAGPLADLTSPVDVQAIRVSGTSGPTFGAYVAWNGDRIGLAWCDESTGQPDLFSRLFDPGGKALGPATQLSGAPARASIPAIDPWKGGFAIAWNEYEPAVTDPTSDRQGPASSAAMLKLVP